VIDYNQKFKLIGKKAVVTGGSGLLGRECVTALAQAGAEVIIADLNEEGALEVINELTANTLRARFVLFDIADIRRLKTNIERIDASVGGIDVWVNAAYPRTDDWSAPIEEIDPESWRKNVDMHLNSYSLSTKFVAERMKAKGGSIINFGSIYGVVGADFRVYEGTSMTMPMAYSAIKGGIINVSRHLASYFGKYNIRINTICPGGVLAGQNPTFVSNYSKKVPMGRMATKEDIAPAVVFLASDASSYITGATIMVDGGWTAI
jgi:NAD(P)-dependent dehydrogenase (short-subunit alcohol dehydrogenase family)